MVFVALLVVGACSVGFLCLAVWGGLILFKNWRFARRADVAEGVVVGLWRKTSKTYDSNTRSMRNRTSTYPTVTFDIPGGKTRSFTSDVSSSHKRQDRVRVIHDPANPEDARISSFVMLYGRPLAGIALSAGMCGVFFYMCVLLLER